MEQDFDIRVYLGILRRRYLHFLIPLVVAFIATVITAFVLPKAYHSQATILVESQQIPSDLARSTVTSAVEERIAVIRQRLMTRSNLLEIVREFNLYPGDQKNQSPSDLVETMREAATIVPVGIDSRRRRENVIAFTVSFEYANANSAARVANRFVELILEQNIRSRTDRASETKKFFQERVRDLEKQMATKEAQIVRFKSENEGSLPDSLAYRRTLLTELQSRIPEIDQKILALQSQMEGLTTNAGDQDTIATQIRQLQVELRQLETIYSERHPSVRRVKSRLAALERGTGSTKPQDQNADNPEDGNRTVSDRRQEALEQQLEGLREQREQEQARIAELEEALLKTPQVEIALNALSREYEALQAQLSQARAKMAEASVGEQLEEDRQAERFEVIEQATAPSKPSKPDRPRIILAGLFVSIAAGMGMVVLFELLDQSIRSSRDLQKQLKLRPIATIPLIETGGEIKDRSRMRRMAALGSALFVVLVVSMTHLFFQPLDVMWLKMTQKLGL